MPPLRARVDIAPATLVQRHIWLMDRLSPDPLYLNIASSFVLAGPLEVATAAAALRGLARRHPVLRTRFLMKDRKLCQQAGADDVEVRVLYLAAGPGSADQASQLARVHAEAAQPFDLARGPCARFVIAQMAPDRHAVIMVAHHIVTDEWSLGVLAGEFARDYAARIGGSPLTVAAPALTFYDYCAWEQECRDKGWFEPQIAFWKRALLPPLARLRLPWRSDGATAADRIDIFAVEIDPELIGRLDALSCREQLSLFVVLLFALKRLRRQFGGEADIGVATNVALRHQPGIESVIGTVTDTLLLRTHLPAGLAPQAALRLVRQSFVSACSHHDVPFEEVARRVLPELGIKRQDLAQVFFVFTEAAAEMQPFAGLTTEPAPIEAQAEFFKSAVHDYDLILLLTRQGDRITGQLALKGRPGDGTLASELLHAYHAQLKELADAAIDG